ncbi:hypothetical protein M409DRAFT_30458 [Zasmidium cellare ATCC 36951]|uniref:Uncharacterized protein n=1 Tax=Zasmidium cellare ATCC 36951 TaxID=1080233 RepID=A0A6A6BYM6_ZASCE|nr:uncharacterized protein M409DRAFT_30458 [Zasmidium cellare ATCC 36951]KAF2159040.1 hypothetical protein M409DRAFT_30458 [Zasmidium cellare ATCC 36951]
MSLDDHIAKLVEEEEANDTYDDDDYGDYMDEDHIRGRAKRGNNKAALKTAKGLAAAATPAANRKSPSKSPSKSPTKSPTKDTQKAATPRSVNKMGTDKSDWKMKLQLSTNQQNITDSYTLEPTKFDPYKTSKSASPKTSKITAGAGKEGGGQGIGTRMPAQQKAEDIPPKKENAKVLSVWDDNDPWA